MTQGVENKYLCKASKSNFGLYDLDSWPPNPQVDRFMPLPWGLLVPICMQISSFVFKTLCSPSSVMNGQSCKNIMPSVSLGWHRHKNDLFSIVLIDSSREKVRKMVHNGAVMEKKWYTTAHLNRCSFLVHYVWSLLEHHAHAAVKYIL